MMDGLVRGNKTEGCKCMYAFICWWLQSLIIQQHLYATREAFTKLEYALCEIVCTRDGTEQIIDNQQRHIRIMH
jgi:hypothetical protein